MRHLIELEARTYLGKEYKAYFKSQEDSEEEGNEWKKDIEEPMIPKTYPSRVFVDPKRIIMAIESYSLEEMANNPEDPHFDSVDLCLEDGIQLSIVGGLNDLQEKIDEYYKTNGA
jgi:hypothetical protein